jgi:hypothetical protein
LHSSISSDNSMHAPLRPRSSRKPPNASTALRETQKFARLHTEHP